MRYAEPARAIARQIRLQSPQGVGLIVVPHREERAVGEAIAAALGWDPPVEMTPENIDRAGKQILLGLSDDDAVLGHLNGRRDWLVLRDALILIPVPQHETKRFVTLCGDVMATIALNLDVAFEADPTVDVADARRALGAAYRARYGQIDLRGLIRRSESDVGWEIEAVYQPLRAGRSALQRAFEAAGGASEAEPMGLVPSGDGCSGDGLSGDDRPGDGWSGDGWSVDGWSVDGWSVDDCRPFAAQLGHTLPTDRPAALLGGPGSGKSFFLRWCAIQGAGAALFGIDEPLPVLLPLAAFAGGMIQQSFAAWITDHLLDLAPAAAHVLPRAMAEGRAVFLLDGLDEAASAFGRGRCVQGLGELRAAAPGCPVVLTSRPEGFDPKALGDTRAAWVQPFDDAEIRAFLRGWCGQYAVDRGGARAEGVAEGEALADAVLARGAIAALARTPLLLTVLAVVHRSGARLPEKRIELYQQITVVLVERWNRLRSLAGQRGAEPIRVGDAVRLLGPVALAMVEDNQRGSISEGLLRRHLRRVLKQGHVRRFEGVDAVLDVFRRSLGLLVEHSPGRYAFAHSTLIEYFAARELVRGEALEARLPKLAFDGRWEETLLLAFAEIGHVRLDDWRLEALIDALIALDGGGAVPPGRAYKRLLAGILLDDPSLTSDQRERLWIALDGAVPGKLRGLLRLLALRYLR